MLLKSNVVYVWCPLALSFAQETNQRVSKYVEKELGSFQLSDAGEVVSWPSGSFRESVPSKRIFSRNRCRDVCGSSRVAHPAPATAVAISASRSASGGGAIGAEVSAQ